MRVALVAVALLSAGCGAVQHGTAGHVSTDASRPVVVAGCEGLYFEHPGEPQLLLVSDFPLEASLRTAMEQMTQAVKLALQDRGFRAGRFTVGYAVCDDSGGNGHFDARRCAANARAAVRVARVVGVIGPLDSACTRVELPTLTAAGIVLVGPLNTADDLTKRGELFVRLSASDSAQAAAAVNELRLRGAKTAVVLADGSPAGSRYAAAFRAAAARAGLRIVANGKADAAYIAGGVPERAAGLIRAARSRVGRGTVLASETLGPASLLGAVAGIDAEGVELAVAGTSSGPYAKHFEQVLGARPHPYAAYAAQAAVILLDAIAESDGTRASVARAVREGRARGPLGTIVFTASGEPKPAPVTIYRIQNGGAQFVHVVDSAIP
ncbi:MAG: ABC transporter substrate-binding protein [Gaiellaceae bacterium]